MMNLKRLQKVLDAAITNTGVIDLMDYTLDSTGENNIAEFYKEIIEQALEMDVKVAGDEISDGKYRIIVYVELNEYSIYSKAKFRPAEIKDAIMAGIIYLYLQEKRCS